MKKFTLLFLLIVSAFVSNAQITDSILINTLIKPYLYTTLPEGPMRNSTGDEVNFMSYIKTKRPFKNKPTLLLTWYNSHCEPCISLIDSILDKKIQKKFNVVLINLERPFDVNKTKDIVLGISENHPTYAQEALLLFDTKRILKIIDENYAPLMFFMDKDMIIAATIPAFSTQVKWVEDLLVKVETKTIVPSSIKFADRYGIPTTEGNAMFRQTIEKVNDIYTLSLYTFHSKTTTFKLNFIKNAKGYFIYHKSSLNTPKIVDLYSEAEICDATKKILSAIDSNNINGLRGARVDNVNCRTTFIIKNFATYLYERGNDVQFSCYMDLRKLGKPLFNGISQEFYHFEKVLNKCLGIKPEKINGTSGGENLYTIREGVYVILKDTGEEVYFAVKTTKDANGKFPPLVKKSSYDDMDYAFMYDIGTDVQFCEDVNKIMLELKKTDKSGILGKKNGNKYESKINIGSYTGTIEETATYFRYTCYLNTRPDESGKCTKEFDRISALLQTCLKVAPQKNHSWQYTDTFLSGTSGVVLNIDSAACTKMWIEITVMK